MDGRLPIARSVSLICLSRPLIPINIDINININIQSISRISSRYPVDINLARRSLPRFPRGQKCRSSISPRRQNPQLRSPPMDDHVRLLRRQYLQLVEPSALSFPASLSSPEVQSAVYSALFAPAAIANPPPERYTTRVLKRLIALLSAESTAAESTAAEQQPPPPPSKKPRVSADHAATRGGEIHEGLLSLYTTLLSQSSTFSPPAAAVAARSHVTYVLPLSPCSGREIGPPVTLLEARSVLSAQGTTGIRTWEAALALSEYLICAHLAWIYKNTAFGAGVGERVLCETDSVLELGAGTGLVAVVAARLGAADVLATDGDEAVCDALRANVKLNGVGDVVAVRRRLWGSGEETRGGVDLVLGADVVFPLPLLLPLEPHI